MRAAGLDRYAPRCAANDTGHQPKGAAPTSNGKAPWLVGMLAFVVFTPLIARALPRAESRGADDAPLVDAMSRIGEYVERYYARAQSIVAQETVLLQPLRSDMSPDGFARRLVYELRVEWNPEAPPDQRATVLRSLVTSRGPSLGPPKQDDCFDPRPISPEPLAVLLPDRRDKFTARIGGSARVNGRAAVVVDLKPIASEPPRVEWDRECGQIDLPGRSAIRIVADAATAEILKYEERLVGMTDIPAPREHHHPGSPLWYTIERADTSIRYQPVRFEDPDETLLLPSQIDTMTVIRNSGMPRLRMTQTFSNYRRYVTGGRLLVP
jgi:hypothetical protein